MKKLAVAIIIFSIAFTACAFDISSSNPSPGEKVTLTGRANPGQDVEFRTSFQLSLPVNSGRYEYQASGVEIPQKPNTFAVTANGVKDLNVGVKIGIWISKRFSATNGAASISQSDVPPGKYDLKVFGEAMDGKTSVSLDVMAKTAVKADSSGKYSLSIDTSGVADGAYKIEGSGETKVIQVGKGAQTASASVGPSIPVSSRKDKDSSSSSNGMAVTPFVISWYAGETGLDPKNSAQYVQAEESLKHRLAGGYWKVIARGDPLTEKAGNCQEEYCLVRGVDACTSCRETEILLLSGKKDSITNDTGSDATQEISANHQLVKNESSANGQNLSSSQTPAGEENGFFDWLKDIIMGILGFNKGG